MVAETHQLLCCEAGGPTLRFGLGTGAAKNPELLAAGLFVAGDQAAGAGSLPGDQLQLRPTSVPECCAAQVCTDPTLLEPHPECCRIAAQRTGCRCASRSPGLLIAG